MTANTKFADQIAWMRTLMYVSLYFVYGKNIFLAARIRLPVFCLCVCLFDLMLYVHGKQLRSCWDGQLLIQTVPGQVSMRHFTSIKHPFFRQ